MWAQILITVLLWVVFIIALYKEWIDELVAILVVMVLGACTVGIIK